MPDGRIRIFTPGLWRLRDEVAEMSGMTPVWHGKADAAAGWGHKSTARWPRGYARLRGVPYIAFEDGFLRSVKPGPAMKPAAMVMDRSGIYYDARQSSDLETLIATAEFSAEELGQAREAIALLRRLRLSKYNHAPDAEIAGLEPGYVLVIDQSHGDQSVPGALASDAAFRTMAEEALRADRQVVAKVHPAAERGYLQGLGANRIRLVSDLVNPWRLIDGASEVHAVSSQLGFEAAFAGKKVICHGLPFYAGWGVTEDRQASPRRARRRTAEDIFAAAYLRYARYFDLWTRKPLTLAESIDQLAFLRDRYLSNTRPVVALRLAPWKRKPVAALLNGPAGPLRFELGEEAAVAKAKSLDADILAWGKTGNRASAMIRDAGVTLVSIEDGFLRSAGLGAVYTPSLSFSIDRAGIYYDPARPSDLETMLASLDVPPAMLAEAKALRAIIAARGLTKYNLGGGAEPPAFPPDREKILVAGQVANDEAVRLAAPAGYFAEDLKKGGANFRLLAEARRRNPEAFIVYKPHPDVETVGRLGAIPETLALQYADLIADRQPMAPLFGLVDRLEVLTSLAGFEALMRGLDVTTHGQPFYAGWGLTTDLYPLARRTRRRTVDELAAIALIAYPRYFDSVSGLPCRLDTVLHRLEQARAGAAPGLGPVRVRGGRWLSKLQHAAARLRGRN